MKHFTAEPITHVLLHAPLPMVFCKP